VDKPLSLDLKHTRASTRCVKKCLHWQHKKKYGGQEDADVVEFRCQDVDQIAEKVERGEEGEKKELCQHAHPLSECGTWLAGQLHDASNENYDEHAEDSGHCRDVCAQVDEFAAGGRWRGGRGVITTVIIIIITIRGRAVSSALALCVLQVRGCETGAQPSIIFATRAVIVVFVILVFERPGTKRHALGGFCIGITYSLPCTLLALRHGAVVVAKPVAARANQGCGVQGVSSGAAAHDFRVD